MLINLNLFKRSFSWGSHFWKIWQTWIWNHFDDDGGQNMIRICFCPLGPGVRPLSSSAVCHLVVRGHVEPLSLLKRPRKHDDESVKMKDGTDRKCSSGGNTDCILLVMKYFAFSWIFTISTVFLQKASKCKNWVFRILGSYLHNH